MSQDSDIVKKVLEKQNFDIWFSMGYSPGHNILQLYNNLVQIWFTTSKRKRDI